METILIEEIEKAEIVINTPDVQYRIANGEIKAMLIGGHRFEIAPETLTQINNAVALTNQMRNFKIVGE